MPKTRRRRAERDRFWREASAARKASGHTITAFCAARGLGAPTLFAKRRELTRQEKAR